MKKKQNSIPRRAFLGGLASSAAVTLSGCAETEPPTYGSLLRFGDVVTYRAHRLLLPDMSLAREYELGDISPAPAIGTTNPANADWGLFDPEQGPIHERLQRNAFADFQLIVEGSVARPGAFSLADLKRMPSRTQITRHTCEEGWSAIAQWTGVPLRSLLDSVGILPSARYVLFEAFDLWADGIDMIDALHPQTILAYGMNGKDLPLGHGAPLRLRVEKQLGYKSTKFVRRIVVTDRFDDNGPLGHIQNGWAWYTGI